MVSLPFRKPLSPALPRRVIVVEDDAVLGLSIVETLTRSGIAEVEVCPSAACTLSKLRRGSFDAMVLDGHLADSHEGWRIAELVEVLGDNSTRIVFQTGSPEAIPERLRQLGPVLVKPYPPQALVEALTEKPRPGLIELLRRKRREP
jgi:CheY-like chemotaxis protein